MSIFQQGLKSLTVASILLVSVPFLSACTTTTESDTKNLSTIERARLAYRHKDYGQTLILLNALVQQDNAEAQYALGYMYRYGQGLPRNQERALYWITLAAKNGCSKAQTALQLLRLKSDAQKQLEEKAKSMSGSCTGEE